VNKTHVIVTLVIGFAVGYYWGKNH